MGAFAKLRAVRAYKMKHLHYLRTVEDYRLVEEIGFRQECGRPITMKSLGMLGVASFATVQRRVKRLRELGAIVQENAANDARIVMLSLSPKVYRAYAKYAELLANGNEPRYALDRRSTD
jgi:DNA-binding MarR family transcriptional regulator